MQGPTAVAGSSQRGTGTMMWLSAAVPWGTTVHGGIRTATWPTSTGSTGRAITVSWAAELVCWLSLHSLRKLMEGVSYLGAGGIALQLISLESKMIPNKTYTSYSLLPGSRGPELMAPCILRWSCLDFWGQHLKEHSLGTTLGCLLTVWCSLSLGF